MLRYLANGRIRWKQSVLCNTRTNWEFYAVIEGRCGPIFHDGERPVIIEKTLWVFAPECSHGWADDGRPFHRIAFHFSTVPYPLDEVVRQRGWFGRRLDDVEIRRIRQIAAELEPHYVHPNLLSPLLFQGRLMDLAALALADHASAQPPSLPDLAVSKVEQAICWYTEHLSRNPPVREVADSVHVSSSHLRRLFWLVRRTSPKTAFQRIRIDKANELMSRSAYTLDAVARHCGFANASHLCREYRHFHAFTPTHWRKRLVAAFAQPLPVGVDPVRQFSVRPAERTMSA
ncbi:MAG TPA: AraC family transcriptional regulator [Opitutaceae bacterium]|nr:AraC family transcriptional regulator [Opitutaceae bacterium]